MGANTSTGRPTIAHEDIVWPAEKLKPSELRNGHRIFYVAPQDDVLRQKSPIVILEIGQDGFRLLRPGDLGPCLACPWGLVHSWSTNGPTFSFRVFEERAKELVCYTMALDEADNLFREIQNTINGILNEKKEYAIAVPDFDLLHKQILAERSGDRLGLLKKSLVNHFFTSLQGQRMVQAMDNSFDKGVTKVEAALLLHAKLIDVSHFQTVLDALECQEDRENVWHRINAMRKKNYNPLKLVSSPSEQLE